MSNNQFEFEFTLLGIKGRMTRRPYTERGKRGKITFMHQKFVGRRTFREDGILKTIDVEVRFDDNCKNGHNDFAITGTIYNPRQDIKTYGDRIESCGCIHEEIAKHFPEVAHLIKWHLVSTDGPMHYPGNALYHASNRDHWGLLKGEPHPGEQHQDYQIYVGNSPVPHRLGRKFMRWAVARLEFMRSTPRTNPDSYDFSVVEVPYPKKPGEDRDYKSQWTMRGFEASWGGAPFATKEEAEGWAKAFNVDRTNHEYLKITKVPTLFGEGKVRELDFARSSAIWPEATDEQLCLPKEELKALLDARLPALMVECKRDIEAAGFMWEVE
ncbi:hypothetical protein Phage2-1_00098 [Achromobacter phage 2-1]|nr:hypothetical protein Phage2-1_00098 [Achromobacter phage 2-1]